MTMTDEMKDPPLIIILSDSDEDDFSVSMRKKSVKKVEWSPIPTNVELLKSPRFKKDWQDVTETLMKINKAKRSNESPSVVKKRKRRKYSTNLLSQKTISSYLSPSKNFSQSSSSQKSMKLYLTPSPNKFSPTPSQTNITSYFSPSSKCSDTNRATVKNEDVSYDISDVLPNLETGELEVYVSPLKEMCKPAHVLPAKRRRLNFMNFLNEDPITTVKEEMEDSDIKPNLDLREDSCNEMSTKFTNELETDLVPFVEENAMCFNMNRLQIKSESELVIKNELDFSRSSALSIMDTTLKITTSDVSLLSQEVESFMELKPFNVKSETLELPAANLAFSAMDTTLNLSTRDVSLSSQEVESSTELKPFNVKSELLELPNNLAFSAMDTTLELSTVDVQNGTLECQPTTSHATVTLLAIEGPDTNDKMPLRNYNLKLGLMYNDLCEPVVVEKETLERSSHQLHSFFKIVKAITEECIEKSQSTETYDFQLKTALDITSGAEIPPFAIPLLINYIEKTNDEMGLHIFNALINSLRLESPKSVAKRLNIWTLLTNCVSSLTKSLGQRQIFSLKAVYVLKYLISILAIDIQRRVLVPRVNVLPSTLTSKLFLSSNTRIMCATRWFGEVLNLVCDSSVQYPSQDELFLLESLETLIKIALISRTDYLNLIKIVARELVTFYQLLPSVDKKEIFLKSLLNLRLIRYFICAEVLNVKFGMAQNSTIYLYDFSNMENFCLDIGVGNLEDALEYMILLTHLIFDYIRSLKEELHLPVYDRSPGRVRVIIPDAEFLSFLQEQLPKTSHEFINHPICKKTFGLLKTLKIILKCN